MATCVLSVCRHIGQQQATACILSCPIIVLTAQPLTHNRTQDTATFCCHAAAAVWFCWGWTMLWLLYDHPQTAQATPHAARDFIALQFSWLGGACEHVLFRVLTAHAYAALCRTSVSLLFVYIIVPM